ncbi:dehydrogenase [Candidatus Parcubacteria bacterium]|nr:MAG: dehydrogenase [Candidatus Parcubacteria bacterium]
MKQIVQNLKSGETILEEVPGPGSRPGHVLIQTRCSLVSLGTERMLVEFSKGNLLAKAKAQPDKVMQVLDKIKTDGLLPTLETVFKRLDEPLPMGYCNAGIIREIPDSKSKIQGLRAGDRVVSNGPHAEVVCVPTNLCAKIPDNVTDEQAAFTVLGAIGLQGIRLANPTLGEKFVVFGAGLIGLLTIQLLRANGCGVLAVDLNEKRLELAESFGASVCNSAHTDPIPSAEIWSGGVGVDGVLITASAKTDEIVHQGAQMCRKRGRIVLVGVVGLNLRRSDFYEKEISFQVSCSYGPGRYDEAYELRGQDYPLGYVRWTEQRNFQAVLDLMASGKLNVDSLITDRIPFAEAERVYEKISGDLSALGVILEYNQDASRKGAKAQRDPQIYDPQISQITPVPSTGATGQARIKERTVQISDIRHPTSGSSPTSDIRPPTSATLALIGSGNFSKMTLAPALAKTSARLKYVSARTNGAAATHIAKKYGFENATTDLEAIWNDPEVNTVFITTQHNSHAALVQQALKAGKHVFVEKPLCLTLEELEEIKLAADPRRYTQISEEQENGLTQRRPSETENRFHGAGKDAKGEQSDSMLHALCSMPLLMVGFNRRFAPHTQKIKELLDTAKVPKSFIMTVNAGVMPPHHWTQDPEVGGGRIIGEACHFVDLIRYLAGSEIVKAESSRMESAAGDTVSISLSFADGSIGSIHYFANGNKGFPKERLEVFCSGKVLQLDNFRVLRGYGWTGFKKMRLWRQDKGHEAELKAFVEAVENGAPSPVPFEEMIEVMETTIHLASADYADFRRL